MDRRSRRDVGAATALGAALMASTLAFGNAFAPDGPDVDRPPAGPAAGDALVLADAAGDGRGGARSGDAPAGTVAGRRRGVASGEATAPGARAGTSPAGRGADRFDGGGAGGVRTPPGGLPDPPVPGGSAGGGPTPAPEGVLVPGDDGPVGDDGAPATVAVRLRVTDLSVTGTDSGTLRAGSEVRVRLTTERENVASGARTAASGAADVVPSSLAASPELAGREAEETAPGAPGAALPDRLDVRIRLDDAAVAALDASAGTATGPRALTALVDLVDGPASGTGTYAVRVRMALTPAPTVRVTVVDAARAADGASDAVAVVAPIGTVAGPEPGRDGPAAPGDGAGPSGDGGPATPGAAAPDLVEVRVPLPTETDTTPEDAATVPVPMPSDAGPPSAGVPATADAEVVVHLPAADEPIGGVPEDLATPPDPAPGAAPGTAASPGTGTAPTVAAGDGGAPDPENAPAAAADGPPTD